ncbi:YidH family protein [Saccharopolyspora cebuensis]|uniref:YidH family protein n=1 Tax=Saccharopolyspora cebuensis TaxID=418759 RepID=A0ABV4CH15_9PSEU
MSDAPSGSRWPRRLYESGEEPDARFTLANERTFLAWIRTALALMAAGVGVEALNAVSPAPEPLRTALAVLLLLGGVLCAATAFTRWMNTERALRRGGPLPAPRLAPVLGYGLGVIGLAACVLLLVTGF